jgi:beta-glucosidase
MEVKVDVQNTGDRDGEEVVQLYLSQAVCRVSRPVKELVAYKRIKLKAGEKQTITFIISPENMSFLNEKLQPELQAGTFTVMAGTNSVEGIEAKFNLM